MTPFDIVNVLTAAAPIVASVASIASSNKSENTQRKEPSSVTNISITVNNNFYGRPEAETINIANQMQNKLIGEITSATRYKL